MAALWKMQEKLLTFLLHMKKLIEQIDCNHPASTGCLLIKQIKASLKQLFYDTFSVVYSYKRTVATGMLQAICFIDAFICRRKERNFSCLKI